MSGSGIGIEDSKNCVYECIGFKKIVSLSTISYNRLEVCFIYVLPWALKQISFLLFCHSPLLTLKVKF